jgi:glycerophosphoryl diester phosphodiesterase
LHTPQNEIKGEIHMKLRCFPFHQTTKSTLRPLFAFAVLLVGIILLSGHNKISQSKDFQSSDDVRLVGRAVLDAATFAPGSTSGRQLGSAPINGQPVPFIDKQPVQGFSAILHNGNGTFLAMSDNGYGSLENSADYNLRVYTIRPHFKTRFGGSGGITVGPYIELHDPNRHIPFTITNQFTKDRVLTGADFDIESMQRTPDGTLWFGDEFGPFLLHTDAKGRVLEPPIPLPDFDNGGEIRSPQNPFNEEASAVRIMNAVRAHARSQGNFKTPVFSPWDVMLADNNPNTFIDNRTEPPAGSGLAPASSEVFNVQSIQTAGYPVVAWTVNDKARMLELMRLGVDGIISDRPDLLRQAVEEFDANNDGTPGDFIDSEGLIDITQFDAQGHRGGRDLRPENTLPAMEVSLDYLMSTLELDTGVTLDRVPVLDHDPYIESQKCRRADGKAYTDDDEVLIKDLTSGQIQSRFICDKLIRGPEQTNNLSLSPVSVAFARSRRLMNPYAIPTLQQVFDFAEFYADYYRSGPGSSHPDAERRWRNAEKARFNIETKVNPRAEFARRTIGPNSFARAVARVIETNDLEERADIQSFDFRTLLEVQRRFRDIRTVYLFGDFPIFADPSIPGSDDGTNLQDENGRNTPWLAGMFWPYRVTALDHPFRSMRSGGFEGMALSHNGRKLLPLLELPLVGGEERTLLIHEFDLASRRYTGERFKYVLNERGTNIGDFIMFDRDDGLIIERDATQGDLNGFKAIYQIELRNPGEAVRKRLLVDLLRINDPHRLSLPGLPGDVGLGEIFAFPFTTIEDVIVIDRWHIGVLNDNNFPSSVGRHVGAGRPDDNEFIVLRLPRPLK